MKREEALFRRSLFIGITLSCLCLSISAIAARWDWFLGLLWGAVISVSHFHLLCSSVGRWLQHAGPKGRTGLAREFLLRLLIAGALLGIGILCLPINFLALGLGLLTVQVSLLMNLISGTWKPEKG